MPPVRSKWLNEDKNRLYSFVDRHIPGYKQQFPLPDFFTYISGKMAEEGLTFDRHGEGALSGPALSGTINNFRRRGCTDPRLVTIIEAQKFAETQANNVTDEEIIEFVGSRLQRFDQLDDKTTLLVTFIHKELKKNNPDKFPILSLNLLSQKIEDMIENKDEIDEKYSQQIDEIDKRMSQRGVRKWSTQKKIRFVNLLHEKLVEFRGRNEGALVDLFDLLDDDMKECYSLAESKSIGFRLEGSTKLFKDPKYSQVKVKHVELLKHIKAFNGLR